MISPATSPTAEPDRDRHDHRQVGEARIDRPRIGRDLGEAHRDHRGGADDRPRGEIDAAGDDHLGDADGDDADHAHLQDHDAEPLGVEEEALPLQDPAQHLEDQRDRDQPEEDIELRRTRPPRRGCRPGRCAGDLCHAEPPPFSEVAAPPGGGAVSAIDYTTKSADPGPISSSTGSRPCWPASPAGTGCRPSARPPRPWRASAPRRARPGPARPRPGTP